MGNYEEFYAAVTFCKSRWKHGDQSAIAQRVGLTPQDFSNILNGRRNSSEDVRERVAVALGYTYENFKAFGHALLPGGLTPDHQLFLAGYAKAGVATPAKIADAAARLRAGENVMFFECALPEGNAEPLGPLGDQQAIPIFAAQGGPDGYWTDSGYPVGVADEYVFAPASQVDRNTFAVRVHGDSMAPTINDGDICLVVPSREFANGHYVFVAFPGEPSERLVKRYRQAGDIVILESINPAYEPIVLTQANGRGARIFRVTQIIKMV